MSTAGVVVAYLNNLRPHSDSSEIHNSFPFIYLVSFVRQHLQVNFFLTMLWIVSALFFNDHLPFRIRIGGLWCHIRHIG